MSSPAYEEDRRRRGFLIALLGGVLLLFLGLFGGWLAFGDDANRTGLGVLSSSSSSHPTTGATVVLPAPQAAGQTADDSATGTSQRQATSDTSASNGNGNGGGSSNSGHPLVVSGTVVGSVGPGSPARLVLTVSNPNNQAVLLTSVTGTVTSVTSAGLAGKPSCSVSWYHVGSFTGSRTIAKNSSTSVELPVTFDDLVSTNQDNCKGARYTYSFTAQARQA